MKEKYGSIQMMRGIAALSVVFAHIGTISNGFFGVDLFFCISGFIMMHVTERSGRHFLEKRAIRIFPLYWCTTLLIVAMLFIKPDFFKSLILTSEHVIKSLLFIPYYHRVRSGAEANALNFVGWTLILEVFFYFLFFISMQISHKNRHYIATAILLTMVIVGFIFKSNIVFIRFYCTPIILEFALGMFSYKLLTRPDVKQWGSFRAIVAIFAATLIWAILFVLTNIPQFMEYVRNIRIIPYGLPTFVVFLLLFKAFEGRSVPKPLIVLGNISYSLYLIHWFVIHGFSRLVYDVEHNSPLSLTLAFLVVIPLIILFSWISWWLIENKLSEWLRKRLKV